jgi:2-polyprenyl-3-methyl-5-hydroxy-6-metoxy-1,4-benzoquinol methylase
VIALALSLVVPVAAQQPPQKELRRPDIFYLPTPHEAVEAMLNIANVTAKDVVYDLGSGDGRIPIAAAKRGARAVGIDIDPVRIKEATANASKQGVSDRVSFRNEDLFEADFGEATVITLYLLQTLNEKLQPKLQKLKPGTRIVSHAFRMGPDWPPDQTQEVKTADRGTVTIYFWTVK